MPLIFWGIAVVFAIERAAVRECGKFGISHAKDENSQMGRQIDASDKKCRSDDQVSGYSENAKGYSGDGNGGNCALYKCNYSR